MKMTQLELRTQQMRLKTLQKYLPTLQLKKGLLQVEVLEARQTLKHCEELNRLEGVHCEEFAALLAEPLILEINDCLSIKQINTHSENIAGIELPIFESVEFREFDYSLSETPVWLDGVIAALRRLKRLNVQAHILRERLERLEKELQEMTTRVNLFEKILIPRTTGLIRKISVFLGDLQLAAVARAKVAKSKISGRKDACRT